MLQKEVADRLLARIGTGEYGVLTVLTALRADVTRVLSLPPGAFRPPPKVHSAVVRLTFHRPTVAVADEDLFVRMVRSIFTQRRKTSANALRPFAESAGVDAGTALMAAGIDPKRRPETMDLDDFARLADALGMRRGQVSPGTRRP
jgi:16S rRNA (adenine1518-N6/adenine1519-N6)-dimethyltransferase